MEAIETSYRSRVPAGAASARERLEYHVDRLVEFAWNVNAYARVKAAPRTRSQKLIGVVRTDVFFCLRASAALIDETLKERAEAVASHEFDECWQAVGRLLRVLGARNASNMSDDVARIVFLVLFIGASILRNAIKEPTEGRSLYEDDLFRAGAYALADEERHMFKGTLSPLLGGSMTSTAQLAALRENILALTETICSRES